MDGKRVAAIVALCMLMLMSGQQQVAANAISRICYEQCYNHCRRTAPQRICQHKCVIKCVILNGQVAAPTSTADCSKICLLISGYGSARIDGGSYIAIADTSGAATCIDDCTKNQSQYAKHH